MADTLVYDEFSLWQPWFDLPYPVHLHCIASINSTTAILTGGHSEDIEHADFVYMINTETGEYSQITSMVREVSKADLRLNNECVSA